MAKKKGSSQDDFLASFLDMDEDATIALPSGEGFVTRGFIGPVKAAVLYSFWSSNSIDLADWLEGGEERQGFTTRGREDSWFYYFRDNDEAREAASYVEAYPPRQVWRWEIPTSEVLNFTVEEPEKTWGTTVGGDVRIVGLRSKYRHEFHMMALPAAVNALAVRAGVLEESAFSLDELLSIDTWTDAVQSLWIGGVGTNDEDAAAFEVAMTLAREGGISDPDKAVRQYILNRDSAADVSRVCAFCGTYNQTDANKCASCGANLVMDAKVLEQACSEVGDIHWKHSNLWQRRKALWLQLGEDDPQAYKPTGSGSKFDTQSKTLNTLLGIVTKPWTKSVWGRLVLVPDPRADATYGDDAKRLTVPVLTEIYPSQEDAIKAAEEELASLDIQSTGETDDTEYPPLPSDWDGFQAEWMEELAQYKKSVKGKLPPDKVLGKALENMSATGEDVKAWWDFV